MTSLRSFVWGACLLGLAVPLSRAHADVPHHHAPSSSAASASPAPSAAPSASTVTDFAAGNGAMSVPRPVGRDWTCTENRGLNETRQLVMVNCRRETPEFYFSARDTTITSGPVPTADSLWQVGGAYRRDIDRGFRNVRWIANHAWSLRGHEGWEVVFDADRNRGGAVRHTERVLVVGNHVFLWIAEASPDTFDGMRREIDRWFDGVRFTALQ